MRRTVVALLAAFVAAGAVAPVATAKVGLAGGSTKLKLAGATAKALASNGVSVAPIGPAKARGGGIAFPITGGSIDPASAAGRIDHGGGLTLSAGKTRVSLRSFRVHVGSRRAILTARAGSARLTILSLGLGKAKLARNGLTTTVRGIRATLSGQAANALNAAFRTELFSRGLPIGSVTLRARAGQYELRGGKTTLALDSGAASALASLGVAAAPIEPASAGDAGLAFPITGGRLAAKTYAGGIRHSGGIRLSKGDTSVELTGFTIRLDSDPDLTANVGGQTVSILDLDLTGLKATASGRRVTLAGVRATLTKAAADALNDAFGTSAFTEGLLLGTATVAARTR